MTLHACVEALDPRVCIALEALGYEIVPASAPEPRRPDLRIVDEAGLAQIPRSEGAAGIPIILQRATASAGPLKNEGGVVKQVVSAQPVTAQRIAQPSTTAPSPSARNRDISIGQPSRGSRGGGGGGAIDPISGSIALGLAGASLFAARRRRRKGQS